jgi:DNA processing protein
VTIVSGLARGLDTSAHRAALEAGGRTIAVMANGIDIVYPAENRKLAEAIVQRGQGALITEYPPGTPPDSRHFPARNRIISGLSLGVLVVEAPHKSGTLLTTDFAAEQGREIFAIPGNINAPNSQGTNRLIQDGAKMVLRPEDILDELRLTYRKTETRQAVEKIVPESPFELELLRAIALEPLHVDEIAIRIQHSIHEISAALAILELRGVVQQSTPMTYQLSPDIDPDSLAP